MSDSQNFDIEALGEAFEAGDPDRVLAFYSDDHEHIEIDAETPPQAPRTRTGAEAVEFLRGAVAGMGASGVGIRFDNPVVGEERAACTITCSFPDGRRLLSNTIFDLADGRIVRQLDIQAIDPERAPQ